MNNAGVLEAGLKPIDCYEDEDLEWVLGINPSSIATPMAKTDPATLNQDMFGQILASDESRAITGQVIVSDFGATL